MNRPTPARASMTMPPTTPPAIAPTLGLDEEELVLGAFVGTFPVVVANEAVGFGAAVDSGA